MRYKKSAKEDRNKEKKWHTTRIRKNKKKLIKIK